MSNIYADLSRQGWKSKKKESILFKSIIFTLLFAAVSFQGTLYCLDVEAQEIQVVQMINDERINQGFPPLKTWDALTLCARLHSQNMADELVAFGHDGFDDRYDEMHEQTFCTRFAENVAYSFNVKDPLKTAVKGWMNSPGHRKNILGEYEETAVGIAYSKEGKFYITQLFATKLDEGRLKGG